MASRILHCVAIAVLLSSGSAQTLQELLPPEIKIDERGLLQWVALGPTEIPCTRCDSKGQEPCPVCRDQRTTVNPGGEEQRCAGCAGEGHFACVLCAGVGALPAMRIGGRDPREASRDQLEVVQRQLLRIVSLFEGVPSLHLFKMDAPTLAKMLADVGAELPLSDGQRERLRALTVAAAQHEKPERAKETLLFGYEFDLQQHVSEQLRPLASCLWRLRWNAGEFVQKRSTSLMRASALSWQGFFGGDVTKPNDTYFLLGRGFFRTRTAENIATVIAAWIAAHPDARVVPVATLEGPIKGNPHARWIYAWVIDGEHHLNVHLVEQGCTPSGTMAAPVPELEVPFEEYREFLHRIETAERVATEHKRGIHGDRATLREQAEARAKEFEQSGFPLEAIAAYEEALELGARVDSTLLRIASCFEKLERIDDAIRACERAIDASASWEAIDKKAFLLRESKGFEVALAWMQSLSDPRIEAHRVPYLVARFLLENRRPAEARPFLERTVELASTKHSFRFDEQGWLVLDEATLAKENNDFADLWPALEELATLCLELNDPDAALRFAAMGVAIGQQLNRCKGYLSSTEVDAGSVPCRFVRARIFLEQKAWDDAAKELRLARTLADRGSYMRWKMEARELELRLAELRKG